MQIAKVQNSMNFKGVYFPQGKYKVYDLKHYIKSDETLNAFKNSIDKIDATATEQGLIVPLQFRENGKNEPVLVMGNAGTFSLADTNLPESEKVKKFNEFANSACARMQYNEAKGDKKIDKILRNLGTH